MLPVQLKAESFASYPTEARAFAMEHIGVLRQMPLALLPSFLNEAIGYDWKLPAERAQIAREMACLKALSPEQLAARMHAFAALRLNADLEASDWVNLPSGFLEQSPRGCGRRTRWTPFMLPPMRTRRILRRPLQRPPPQCRGWRL